MKGPVTARDGRSRVSPAPLTAPPTVTPVAVRRLAGGSWPAAGAPVVGLGVEVVLEVHLPPPDPLSPPGPSLPAAALGAVLGAAVRAAATRAFSTPARSGQARQPSPVSARSSESLSCPAFPSHLRARHRTPVRVAAAARTGSAARRCSGVPDSSLMRRSRSSISCAPPRVCVRERERERARERERERERGRERVGEPLGRDSGREAAGWAGTDSATPAAVNTRNPGSCRQGRRLSVHQPRASIRTRGASACDSTRPRRLTRPRRRTMTTRCGHEKQ